MNDIPFDTRVGIDTAIGHVEICLCNGEFFARLFGLDDDLVLGGKLANDASI